MGDLAQIRNYWETDVVQILWFQSVALTFGINDQVFYIAHLHAVGNSHVYANNEIETQMWEKWPGNKILNETSLTQKLWPWGLGVTHLDG